MIELELVDLGVGVDVAVERQRSRLVGEDRVVVADEQRPDRRIGAVEPRRVGEGACLAGIGHVDLVVDDEADIGFDDAEVGGAPGGGRNLDLLGDGPGGGIVVGVVEVTGYRAGASGQRVARIGGGRDGTGQIVGQVEEVLRLATVIGPGVELHVAADRQAGLCPGNVEIAAAMDVADPDIVDRRHRECELVRGKGRGHERSGTGHQQDGQAHRVYLAPSAAVNRQSGAGFVPRKAPVFRPHVPLPT